MAQEAPQPLDTQILFARARDGDERAMGELYRRYIDRVRRWAHGKLSPRARGQLDTDIVAHDVLTRVILRTPELRKTHEHCFRSYVSRSLANAVTNANKRARVEQVELEAVAHSLADGQPGPEEELLYRMFEEAVEAAFRELKPEQQKVLTLRKVHDLSHAEVARHIGVDREDTARMRCQRAREALERNLRRRAS